MSGAGTSGEFERGMLATPDALLLIAVTLLESSLPYLRTELECTIEVDCELSLNQAGEYEPKIETLGEGLRDHVCELIALIHSVQRFTGFEVAEADATWLDDLIEHGLPKVYLSMDLSIARSAPGGAA